MYGLNEDPDIIVAITEPFDSVTANNAVISIVSVRYINNFTEGKYVTC